MKYNRSMATTEIPLEIQKIILKILNDPDISDIYT